MSGNAQPYHYSFFSRMESAGTPRLSRLVIWLLAGTAIAGAVPLAHAEDASDTAAGVKLQTITVAGEGES